MSIGEISLISRILQNPSQFAKFYLVEHGAETYTRKFIYAFSDLAVRESLSDEKLSII